LRSFLPVGLTALTTLAAVIAVGVARAAQSARPPDSPGTIRALRSTVDYYRQLAWTYQRAAHRHTTRTSLAYKRSADGAYLRWTLSVWEKQAHAATVTAVVSLRTRLGLHLPAPPGVHASLPARIAYAKHVTARLRRLYPAQGTKSSRSLASARPAHATQLRLWEARAASAALDVSRHVTRWTLAGPPELRRDFLCIHHYEGAWNSATGNGYYGGLQMNLTFMQRYGADFLRRYGTADRWPAWAQVQASVRAYEAGRGFWPWPRTAVACGLL
jgi:hypothetical protein